MRNFFNNLPSEITSNIFLRLPVDAIATSKCVCKPWLSLLESNDFVNSHLAQSVPGLAVKLVEVETHRKSFCTIFEFRDGDDFESHNVHYNQMTNFDFTKFDFPRRATIMGSANGLLFLFKDRDVYWVCNPITRDYIEVRCPDKLFRPYNLVETIEENVYIDFDYANSGFGVSKISGQYKVVRISHYFVTDHRGSPQCRIIPECKCHVYTLGTGLWRRVEVESKSKFSARFKCKSGSYCVFFNGNLHWIASDSDEKQLISCFDVENERFSHFSTPPNVDVEEHCVSRGYCLFWEIAYVYVITRVRVRRSFG